MKCKLMFGILSCVLAAICFTGCGANDADSAATNTEAPAQTTEIPKTGTTPSTKAESATPAAPTAQANETPNSVSDASPSAQITPEAESVAE